MEPDRRKRLEVEIGTELREIMLKEISSVDDPAYGAAGWLLMKASMTTADLPEGALSRSGAALGAVLDPIPLGELVKMVADGEFDHLPFMREQPTPTLKFARPSLVQLAATHGSVVLR
jgi:hypothetical protein